MLGSKGFTGHVGKSPKWRSAARNTALLLALAGSFGADAPTSYPEWLDAQQGVEARFSRANALENAAANVHNAMVLADGKGIRKCAADEAGIALRSSYFVDALAIEVNALAAAVDGLAVAAQTPLVKPLLSPDEQRRLADAQRRSDGAVRRSLEIVAWQKRYAPKCKGTPFVGPGFGPALPTERDVPLAVLAVGVGRLCPRDIATGDRIHVLKAPVACYGAKACDCVPQPVRPGEVIGPRPIAGAGPEGDAASDR